MDKEPKLENKKIEKEQQPKPRLTMEEIANLVTVTQAPQRGHSPVGETWYYAGIKDYGNGLRLKIADSAAYIFQQNPELLKTYAEKLLRDDVLIGRAFHGKQEPEIVFEIYPTGNY